MKREQVRKIDQIAMERYGLSGIVLMENAGRGAAERIAAFSGSPTQACIVCGTGNNGGDGYVIARHLELLGFAVRIVSLVSLDRLSGDAKINADIASKAGISITCATTPREVKRLLSDECPTVRDELIVDCMLGTGATGELRGIYRDAVQVCNERNIDDRNGARIAIDLPTGLDCDSGVPGKPTFQADLTITFVALKNGFSNSLAKPVLGSVEVVGIGAPKVLLNEFGVDCN